MFASSAPDEYGHVHPNETQSLVRSKLEDLELELAKLSKKDAYEQAQTKCPDQLTDAFKLMFLRCEVFDAILAASHLIQYWETRLKIFGPDLAFRPMTQEEAFKDDAVALGTGFWQLVPAKDKHGRIIVWHDASQYDKMVHDRESMARSMWYAVHAALDDETTQKKGIVIIVYKKYAKFANFDRFLLKINCDSTFSLPMRISAIHICHPPSFWQIVLPIYTLLLGETRKLFRTHKGSDEDVLEQLAKVGLPKDSLPSELGGDILLDHTTWLADRKAAGK